MLPRRQAAARCFLQRRMRGRPERYGLSIWGSISRSRYWYPLAQRLLTAFLRRLARNGWIKRLPLLGAGWTKHRDMPAPAATSFQAQWKSRREGNAR